MSRNIGDVVFVYRIKTRAVRRKGEYEKRDDRKRGKPLRVSQRVSSEGGSAGIMTSHAAALATSRQRLHCRGEFGLDGSVVHEDAAVVVVGLVGDIVLRSVEI